MEGNLLNVEKIREYRDRKLSREKNKTQGMVKESPILYTRSGGLSIQQSYLRKSPSTKIEIQVLPNDGVSLIKGCLLKSVDSPFGTNPLHILPD